MEVWLGRAEQQNTGPLGGGVALQKPNGAITDFLGEWSCIDLGRPRSQPHKTPPKLF